MSPRGRHSSSNGRRYAIGGKSGGAPLREWEVHPELLWDGIRAVVDNGDAILIGAVRAGGALRVTVYVDGEEPDVAYVANVADFTSLLQSLRDNPLSDR